MDVKMGARTFTEEDAEITDLRADLLQKMQKIDRSAPTAEELAAGGVTKSRYLYFRDSTTTTTEMGFRVDGCQLADGLDAQVPDTSELRTITELDEVLSAVSSYVQRRKVRDRPRSTEICARSSAHAALLAPGARQLIYQAAG